MKYYSKTLLKKINILFSNQKIIFIFYFLVTVIASIQKYLINQYSVYHIYKYASIQLLSLSNIYTPFPQKDLFLYSPTFAFLFIPFAVLPNILGCILWNLFGIIVLFLSIQFLKLNNLQKSIILIIIFFEALLSIQNFQANVLLTGICILVFTLLEKSRFFCAALCASLGFFLKIFGIGFAVLFLFYKRKTNFLIFLLISFIVLLLLPLLTSNFSINYLFSLYNEWIQNLVIHQTKALPINIYGVIKDISLSNADYIYSIIIFISMIILALPLVRFSYYNNCIFKQYFLSSLLIWVVVFSKNAESPTYIIAMTGVAIWFISERPTPLGVSLLILAIVFTSLSATDLFPPVVRRNFCYKFRVKLYPCLIIWIYLQIQLLFKDFKHCHPFKTPKQ